MRILGTGSALPAYTLTNERLTEFLDTSDEWISTRTGIRSRQVMTTETILDLAMAAGKSALENAGLQAADIDFIICSTVQGDFITPSMACLIQGELGATCGAMDINGACAGFIYGLDLADAYLKAGKARRILLVCAEGMSKMVDWTDRSVCVLFGDGAGAVVLDGGEGVFHSRLTSEGTSVPLRANAYPGNSPFLEKRDCPLGLYMDGQEVYKFAVSHSLHDIQTVTAEMGLTADDISHYLLHQANKRIVDAVKARLKQPDEKFPCNVAVRGNTSSASVPILLDEINRAGSLKKGEKLVLSAFGAGLTTGACVIEWTRD